VSAITRQLERDARFMRILPYADIEATAFTINKKEAYKISASLHAAAERIGWLEQELSRRAK